MIVNVDSTVYTMNAAFGANTTTEYTTQRKREKQASLER